MFLSPGMKARFRNAIHQVGPKIGIGTAYPDQQLTVSSNTSPLQPATSPGDGIHVGAADGVPCRLTMDTYINGVAGTVAALLSRNARGTAAIPSALIIGDNILNWTASGYGTTGYGAGANVRLRSTTREAFTDTAHGCDFQIATCRLGAITVTETMRCDVAGSVSIGSQADANAAAILDVTSTTKGFAPPRMTEAQRDAISSPIAGLEVFVSGAGIRSLYDGNGWASFGGLRRVSTQFDKTNDGTLANVPGLSVNVAAGKTYAFHAVLHLAAGVTGGAKSAIAGTCTATAIVYQINTLNLTTSAYVVTSRLTALASAGGSNAGGATQFTTIDGVITVNAAGTLTVQFAQNGAGGVGTTASVLVGSTFELKEIA